MAKRITDEQKEMINELYLECGIKKKVAEIMGISPASVSKYIIPNYVSKKQRPTYTFEGKVGHAEWLIDIFKMFDNPAQRFCELCMLDEHEKAKMAELQKEIYI